MLAVGGGADGWVGSKVSAVVSSLWLTRLRVPAGAAGDGASGGAADAVLMGAVLAGGGVQPGGGSNALFGLAARVGAAATAIGAGVGAVATSAAGGGAEGTVEAVLTGAALVGGVQPGGGSNALFGLAGRVGAAATGIGAGIGAGAGSTAGGGASVAVVVTLAAGGGGGAADAT
jgi:hypothetical protein